jgi:hypothetical protein
MLLVEVNQKVNELKKGAYTKATWCSFPLKNKSQIEYSHRVKKVTSGVVRIGIEYANLSSMVGKEIGPSKKGHKWYSKNYITSVVDENEVVQQYKIRLYMSKSPKHRCKTKWYFDDMEVTKEWLLENGYMTQAQYDNKYYGDRPFIEFSIENLISLGKEC